MRMSREERYEEELRAAREYRKSEKVFSGITISENGKKLIAEMRKDDTCFLKGVIGELFKMHKELCDIHGYPYPEATYGRVREALNEPYTEEEKQAALSDYIFYPPESGYWLLEKSERSRLILRSMGCKI